MRKSVVYLGLVMMLSVSLATSCSKKDNTDKNTDIVTITPEVTPSIAPEGDKTEVITPTPTIIEEPKYIGEKEATKLVVDAILERGYFVQYNEDMTIGENEYYVFSILNGDDIMNPNVIVNKVTGEILCLNEDKTTSSLNTHPLLSSMNENKDEETDEVTDEEKDDASEEGKFSIDDAYKMLSKVSKDVLSLPVELSEYTIVYDDYNTIINGQECFGINTYSKVDDKMISMGVFYVAVDGSAMYKFDVEADDFVEIK